MGPVEYSDEMVGQCSGDDAKPHQVAKRLVSIDRIKV
jgi:hypothetical protein